MQVPGHPLFEALKALPLTPGEFALFGSAPLWVRGIRQSDDLDIIAIGDSWQRVLAAGERCPRKVPDGLEYVSFAEGKIEVYNGWYRGEWDIAFLIQEAEIIDGLPFVRLEQVVRWKKIMDREKDRRDLELIAQYQMQLEKNT